MNISLKRKHTMVFGLKHSGKSNFVQWLISQPEYSSHIAYDVCKEHDVLNTYSPNHRRGKEAIVEFGGVVERLVTEADRGIRPELLIVEEISRLAPNRGSQSDALMELVDLNRHYDVGIVGIARRPAQVQTDLVELADQLVIFRLTGKNDVQRLNREAAGLGDAARELDDYHFIVVGPDRRWQVHEPVPEMDTTGKL